ncbi:MAG: protein-export chaperone SecB [Pseudomonadales bacterium]|nr:protein-export chaperone SecB [Pseudomonadales bacterium]
MATQADAVQNRFGIQKLYVKDVSFESPGSPEIFRQQWKPDIQMEMNAANAKVDEHLFEIVLTITITAKIEEETAFLVEIQQAGIFEIQSDSDEEMKRAMGSFCPNILFPYAREAIDSLVTRGGFPPLMLAPVNFDALFVQAQQEAEAGDTPDAAPAPASPTEH